MLKTRRPAPGWWSKCLCDFSFPFFFGPLSVGPGSGRAVFLGPPKEVSEALAGAGVAADDAGGGGGGPLEGREQ